MTEIVFINCDSYTAVYVDGKLDVYSEEHNVDFDYGFSLGKQYPTATIVKKYIDFDWYDNISTMPEDIEDVKFK